MRILIVHHYQIPKIGEYISGEGLRVRQLLNGLSHYEYDVHQFSCIGYSPSQIQQQCRDFQPNFIIATQAHLVSLLAPLDIPLIFDLFAHRLMEAQFEDKTSHTTMELIHALHQCSIFLVSNDRQRWSWQGIISLLGGQSDHSSALVVPLWARISESRQAPSELRLVGGGMWWPWQNPWPALQRALAFLDRKGVGEICWYGVGNPQLQHPRLQYMGRVSHHAFRSGLLSASAAFDWMESNIEREFAIAFRHMDYLGCGLPILTGSYSPLSSFLGGAGWIDDNIEKVLDQLIEEPDCLLQASQLAHQCARRFSLEETLRPLHEWIAAPKIMSWREDNPLLQTTSLWKQNLEDRSQLERIQTYNETLEKDVQKKSEEIKTLRSLVEKQQGSIDHLSMAVSDVVSYRKEAIQVLGGQIEQHNRTAHDLTTENAILRADITKKTAELEAMDQLRARLENDIQALRVQLEKKKGLWSR